MQKVLKLLQAQFQFINVVLLDQRQSLLHNDVWTTQSATVRVNVNAALQERCVNGYECSDQAFATHNPEDLQQQILLSFYIIISIQKKYLPQSIACIQL